MINKLSAADWRLLSAVLAVIFLLVATEPSADCENCVEEKHQATFIDQFAKQETFLTSTLPNAYVIIHNAKNKNSKSHAFPMVSGESKTVYLEGQEAYAYMILELDWADLHNLSTVEKAALTVELTFASKEKQKELIGPYGKPNRCIEVGLIMVDTTISFGAK